MRRLILFFATCLGGLASAAAQGPDSLRLGVVADRPAPLLEREFAPLADYLSQQLEGRRVELRILPPDALGAIANGHGVDLLLADPQQFVALRSANRLVTPIATLARPGRGGGLVTAFGGVIIVAAGSGDLMDFADLAGRRVAVPGQASLGGFLAPGLALKEQGLALSDLGEMLVLPTHDAVVQAVLDAAADAGFLRTGVLEQLVVAGELDLARLRVINPQKLADFPFRASTRLYPEWPVVALSHLDTRLVSRLAAALIGMPAEHPAARAAGIAGFVPAADYSAVESAARTLRLPPFEQLPKVLWQDVWARYWQQLLAGLALLWLIISLAATLWWRGRQLQRSTARLAESHRQLDSLMNGLVGMAYRCRHAGQWTVEYVSEGALALTGRPASELTGRPRDGLAQLIHPDDLPQVRQAVRRALEQHEAFELEYRIRHRDGSTRQVIERGSGLIDARGHSRILQSLVVDISEDREREEKLRLAASVFTHASEGIMISDHSNTIVEVNDSLCRITGYSRDELVGQNPRMLRSGEHEADFYRAMWEELQTHGGWSGEVWNRRRNGEVYPQILTISAVRGAEGQISHYVAIALDISDLKAQQQELEYVARYDALTGLPNRVLLTDRINQALARARRQGGAVAVAYIDLDGFKPVNDEHGHDVGDAFLVAIANQMRLILRESDTIARIGGDEFIAVVAGLENPQQVTPELDRMLAAVCAPVHVRGLELQVSASIGVSFFPQGEGTLEPDQLIRQADQAMYQAKLSGKNRYCLFDAQINEAVRVRHEARDQVRHALHLDQLFLQYQPKVNLRTGALVGAEALLRMHSQAGPLPPDSFLPAVRNDPLAVELGEWVIRRALTQIQAWQLTGLKTRISVNIDGYHLQQDNFVERLRVLLAERPQVNPRQLQLEVLETSALQDVRKVAVVMQGVTALGVSFAIDDFGTGYSSLTYLKHLPAAELKIDRSFVRDALDDPDDLAILEGVIGLAAAFQRDVVAEGVETVAHGELLLQLGCELAQGYAIARPMSATELPGWAREFRPDVGWPMQPVISRARLPLLFARVEHQALLRAAEAAVASGEPPARVPWSSCRLESWLRQALQGLGGRRNDLKVMEQLHREFHRLSEELSALLQRRADESARQRLAELRHVHMALQRALSRELGLRGPLPAHPSGAEAGPELPPIPPASREDGDRDYMLF